MRIPSSEERTRSGSERMVICLVTLWEGPWVLVPVMVTTVSFTSAEDPLTTPVAGSRENPSGRVPSETAQVTPMSSALVMVLEETGVP